MLGDPMVCPSHHLQLLAVLACVLTNETLVPCQDPPDVTLSMISKADYWLQKGLARRDCGRVGRAVYNFTEAIKVDRRCWMAYLLRAVCLLRQKHYSRAKTDLETFLQAHPTNFVALYNLALALCALGDNDAGLQRLNRAVECCTQSERSKHPYLFQARAMLLRRKV